MTADTFEPARAVLRDAIQARAFPAAVAEVGRADRVVWREAFGVLTFEPDATPTSESTIFDLASLTKVIATATIAMRLMDRGRLDLEDRVADRLPEWRGTDREMVTIRDLLAHCSGLTGYLPFYRDHVGRKEFQQAICSLPLEYPPRSRSIYSDLGFMLLGFIIEDAGAAPLAAQFGAIATLVQPEPLAFTPPRPWRSRTAPTEIDPWRGRLLVGETHDENTWALGGAAGQAGLFGSAGAVGSFAQLVLQTLGGANVLGHADTMRTFVSRADVPGSSRALGWDTMLPTSSCGRRMSAAAFGHTGFTGTSLWVDPTPEIYVVLLTNRVHPTRRNEAILEIRPRLHDAIVAALGY